MNDTDSIDLDRIAKHHWRDGDDCCHTCGRPSPCETEELLIEVRRLQAENPHRPLVDRRCTCTMIDQRQYKGSGIDAPEWEQDPWCPVHPDTDVIYAEVQRAQAAALRDCLDPLLIPGWGKGGDQ